MQLIQLLQITFFEECFEKLFADKLRILVTHQTKFLPRTNQILVMDESKILHSGSYEQLVEQGLHFLIVLSQPMSSFFNRQIDPLLNLLAKVSYLWSKS